MDRGPLSRRAEVSIQLANMLVVLRHRMTSDASAIPSGRARSAILRAG